jgi:hypothetical protein
LPGNTASVIVSELLGDGNYQVKPTERIVFHSGRLNLVDNAIPIGCGCPPPAIPVLRTANSPDPVVSEAKDSSSLSLAQPGDELRPVAATIQASGRSSVDPSQVSVSATPETAALPPSKPGEVHVQVDAPFVFRAQDLPPNQQRREVSPPPVPVLDAELRQAATLRPAPSLELSVLAPSQSKTPHRGVMGRIKGFFAAIFSQS